MTLTISTPLIELHKKSIARLSQPMARRLAMAVASYSNKSDLTEATVEDLLNYFPMRYEDRSNLLQIDQLYDGLEASVELYTRVSGGFQVGKNRAKKAPPLYIFEISGGDAERTRKPVVVYWFVSGKAATNIINYYKERFDRGTRFVAYGKWEWDSRRNTFALKVAKPDELEILPTENDPESFGLLKSSAKESEPGALATEDFDSDDPEEDFDHPEFATIHTGRHVPIYRKLGQFQTKRLREIISDVFQKLDRSSIEETLPPDLIKTEKLIPRSQALGEIHFPPEGAKLIDYEGFRSPAHYRLIFEEFFWVVFALTLIRGERRKEPKGTVIEITDSMEKRFEKIAPFPLTGAQHRVLKRIFADLTSDAPMNRLIQGDVGSGKTIVAFIAALAAMENGYQAAMMAPTEILAEQHARNAVRIFADTSYNVGLLRGSMKAAEKRAVQEAIATGETQFIVGTHAIIQDAVRFENLGLAIIDEQHRFGVLQRSALRELGYNPDVLVMTATPIPRSLAMTVYGDLDVSVIDELPPGRTPIKTVVVGEDQRSGVYKGIEREIKLGRQCYVVYPLIEESEKIDLKAATKMFEHLRDVFPHFRVGLLHGKMKSADKEDIMARFVSGELNILVSTTVIEVGVDVPNASLMIIEHAERFGLSQLHQLRGRVGRGAEQSFCVLLTGDKKTAVAKERLGIMEETSDGFRIAEKDLEIRGQGDILGTRQSGIQQFRIANIIRDLEILEQARNAAELYLGPKRLTSETSQLIERVKSNPRFHLAGVG
ncbi:MAG TPA: ATP-dependent DNA helicase RecG [Pyrinomonadaceae bacterium]|jgi:ATP-dependent DNA helicase RecG|nr:ATP-dependent DNA helicase RecG [Pyrinomonadaceae bacterium]